VSRWVVPCLTRFVVQSSRRFIDSLDNERLHAEKANQTYENYIDCDNVVEEARDN